MISVSSIQDILILIKTVKGYSNRIVTNFFLDIPKTVLWIRLNSIFYEVFGQTAFIFRKNQGFYNLFYISIDKNTLKSDLGLLLGRYENELFVSDIVGRKSETCNIIELFEDQGFFQFSSLVRMSKGASEDFLISKKSDFISYAGYESTQQIYDLLQHYFDRYAEQLPLVEEIEVWIENSRIIIFSDDNRVIQGFLIFDLLGMTSYLRYWFVHPDHRDKKIGSSLLRSFFIESREAKRQLFWVIESNGNAIKRYEHYGFRKEDLSDCIMINKNICYGGESN